ncbi:MAG: ATP-dependent helicase [Anaerolineae bacterium]|jgi:DNA helicase-2/ATP-dependent DNA helicase PcrA|nr:ATP-dependent helicase [Anaerolineae bacterium]
MAFQPRPSQLDILEYQGGKMGVAAVPGSGKTHTLALLAARLVLTAIDDEQEVLIVTLVNSAVDNFRQRINRLLVAQDRGLLPGFGYRVRTLHGLAHDIVRERPSLVGLAEDFGIIDEREAEAVRDDAVEGWLRAHPEAADAYLLPELEAGRADWVRRSRWPALVRDVAAAFIKRAKDLELTPDVLLGRLAAYGDEPGLGLARMGAEIYAEYQRSLAFRGMVDFDDLIRLALEALKRDPDYLERLRRRWPYVLEDEAQDSSRLQQEILSRLAGDDGNWVRVGDPNQAIYETFTTADPDLLRRFVSGDPAQDVQVRELPESGRSQPAIIALANTLIDWVRTEHPLEEARGALTLPYIQPTPPGDPQPNPPANPRAVQLLLERDFTPEAELAAVAESARRWLKEQEALPEAQRETCAILAPRNQRGFEMIDLLEAQNVPHVELLRSTSLTRQAAGALGNVLRALADPTSARKLSVALLVWRRGTLDDPETRPIVEGAARRLRGCPAVEAYLWPRADHDWLASLAGRVPEAELALLAEFRQAAQGWHLAAGLPIDQLVLTLAGDLFREPGELALAHKLALLLRDAGEAHPGYRLPEMVEELAVIARNERRFLGFAAEETGFAPPRGKVTVATMHKAKGLEWDRVYLLSVNTYDFPSGLPTDTYVSEPWFIRDRLNLEAEAMAQLERISPNPPTPFPTREGGASSPPLAGEDPTPVPAAQAQAGRIASGEGSATRVAREEYVSERLRLLYVGITRARRTLIVTWNTGRREGVRLEPALPLVALHEAWQEEGSDA